MPQSFGWIHHHLAISTYARKQQTKNSHVIMVIGYKINHFIGVFPVFSVYNNDNDIHFICRHKL